MECVCLSLQYTRSTDFGIICIIPGGGGAAIGYETDRGAFWVSLRTFMENLFFMSAEALFGVVSKCVVIFGVF